MTEIHVFVMHLTLLAAVFWPNSTADHGRLPLGSRPLRCQTIESEFSNSQSNCLPHEHNRIRYHVNLFRGQNMDKLNGRYNEGDLCRWLDLV